MKDLTSYTTHCEALGRHLSSGVFRALGDETRSLLLSRLACAGRPLTVTEAASCCGVHLSGVSRHLKVLREAGCVASVKRGREVAYEIRCAELARLLRGLADALDACCAAAACGIETTKENEDGAR